MQGVFVCLILCLLLFLSIRPVLSEEASGEDSAAGEDSEVTWVDPTRTGEGYSVVLYDIKNGLPTSEANAIAQTEEGFLWIGSYSGLIRYDGNTFERVDSTSGIASVVSLFVDSRNRLWVGTNDGGVGVIDRGKVRMFNREDGLKSLSVRAIAEDPDGNIYIATTRGIVEINDHMDVRTIDQTAIRDCYVRSLRIGCDGILYGLTQSGCAFTMEKGAMKQYYDLPKMGFDDVVSLCPDPDHPGGVYLGTGNSSWFYGNLSENMSSYRKYSVPELDQINEITPHGGDVWMCADNGIGVMKDGILRKLQKVPMNNSVEHMMVDYQGNLWFTSSRQGVMKVVNNVFADVTEWYGLEDLVVNSTCLFGDRLLVGTDRGLVVLSGDEKVDVWAVKEVVTASGATIDIANLITLLNGCRIRSIVCDDWDRIWFSTYSKYGLVCYDHRRVIVYTMDDGLPSNRVRTVHVRENGEVLAACNGGIAFIHDENVQYVYDEKDGLLNTEILTIEETGKGAFLVGTDGGGIFIINNMRTFMIINTESGLSSDVVMRIRRDPSREIYWIVASNGISYMDAEYNVTRVAHFPYSNNFDLYDNGNGNLWVLSSNGIYVVPVEQMLANGEIQPVFFSNKHGLPCMTTANSYSALTDEGDLYIAGSTGVVKVNIKNPIEDVSRLKINVPYVTVDGERFYPDGQGRIVVPANADKITIPAYVFTYSLNNPAVSYRLKGFEKRQTTVQRSEFTPVSYTNLSGGTYYFEMVIADSIGSSSVTYSVCIIKQRAIYEQWWFRVLAALLAVILITMIVLLYVRRKTRKLIAKQQEQKTFIREMIEAFAKTIDMKDRYTNGHSKRVAEFTALLATELGCDEDTVDKYYNIALLHDIGKIGVPAAVLNKQGKLSDEEFKIIKSHAHRGYEVLKDISIMPELAIGARSHHERPDGKGYPQGLKGDEIPRVAQIIAVADTFDAMYSDRPYRKRMQFDRAVSIVKEASGTQLSADVVEAFLRLVEKGYFRAPDDDGGGTTEDIDNIHKAYARAKEIGREQLEKAQKK